VSEPPRAQPPLENTPAQVEPAAKSAAGVPAIAATLRQLSKTGVVRGVRTLSSINQAAGFDCPGCAWPEPAHDRSAFEFCENGAKHVADEATRDRATPELFGRMSVAQLSEKSDEWLNAQGRLTHPLVLEEDASHYRAITWDDAVAIVAEELKALRSPDEAVFYTSGRTSNEAAFLYQLFARQLGTNNLPDCSNMCHESSGHGLVETLGVGKGTVGLEDFDVADAIFVIGQNPGSNHPRMLVTLEAAARRGCAIVSINPLREAGLLRFSHPQDPTDLLSRGTELTRLFLQIRINGDVALLKAIMKEMLAEESRRPGSVLDREFIERHTTGFDAFASALTGEAWPHLERQCGVAREQIREAARIAIHSKRTIVCWAMGLTQHKNAVSNVQEVVNFLLLRGNVGRPGAGVCPVRGHSNVQGDRTMGISECMPDVFLDRLAREFSFDPPRKHGYDTIAAIRAMSHAEVRVFFAMGGNFLSAAPDTEATARALRRCRLTAHVSTKLNRSHLVTGRRALILPCLGRTELDVQRSGPQMVSVENSMGIVHGSRGTLAPASSLLRSEPAIVAAIAKATLGGRSTVDWDELVASYDHIRDAIARVVPGFDAYNQRVREPGGFTLPNTARERAFELPGGRARFTVHALPRIDLAPGELLMMTIRSHDQFNTTVYSSNDRYRGIKGGRRVVLVNAEDAAARELAEGDVVDIVGRFRDDVRIAESFQIVHYDIPRGCVATYYPEANVLVPLEHHADVSRTPASKSVVVELCHARRRARAHDAP
jgi:molybdopterin-dependent oxidoreductase alpha subunit